MIEFLEHISNLLMLVLDKNLTILHVNKGGVEYYGYSRSELKGRSLSDLLPPDSSAENLQEEYLRILHSSSSSLVYETERVNKKGKRLQLSIIVLAVEFYGERCLLEIGQDISYRLSIEKGLRNALISFTKLNELSEMLYSTTSSSDIFTMFLSFLLLPEGLDLPSVGIIAPSERNNQAFLYRLAAEDFEKDHREVLEQISFNPLFREKIIRMQKLILHHYRNQPPYPVHLSFTDIVDELKKKRTVEPGRNMPIRLFYGRDFLDGPLAREEWFQEQSLIIPIEVLERVHFILVINQRGSIVESGNEAATLILLFATHFQLAYANAILYEKLQEQVKELESAYRSLEESQQKLIQFEKLAAIGELTAQIAHEIRNPLVSLGGFGRLIEKKSRKGTDIHKYAGIIVQEVERLEHILGNMLDFIRIDRIHARKLNFNKLIYRTLELFRNSMPDNITIEFLPDMKCPLVMMDEEKIHQVLINLLKNAVQAMKNGGKITVMTRGTKKYCRLTIEDEGPGIPPEVRDRLYSPFISTHSGGTGLGLAITKKILDAHQAKITITDRKPNGTRVSIIFKYEFG